MSNRSILIILGAVILIGAGLTLILYRIFVMDHYLNIPLSENVIIDAKGMEIQPAKPLKVEREFQLVSIEVAPPFIAFGTNGMSLPNGQRINPEITVVDNNGQEYKMIYKESLRSARLFESEAVETASYGSETRLPRTVQIEKVLLRSEVPISAKRILWSCYNWKDVHD